MTVSSGPGISQGALDPEAGDLAPIAAAREKYRPELDGIRALCIIFTVFNHIPNCPRWINGVAGVDIFFPLSGWLITSLLVREYQESGKVDLKSFWIRRIFRIMPLYYVTAAIYIALSMSGAKTGAVGQLHSAFVYMVTMNMEYRPIAAGSLFGHAWTLGIEEKFYLVWPLILATLIRKPALAGLVAGAAVLILGVLFGFSGTMVLGYIGLGIGSCLSLLSLTNTRFRDFIASAKTRTIFLIGMLVCYISYVLYQSAIISDILLSATSAFVIGSLWFGRDSVVSRFFSTKPLPWLGRLTYAMYLIQSLCIRLILVVLHALHVDPGFFIVFVLAYGVSVAFALLMHRYLELPMIRLGKSLASRYSTGNSLHPMPGAKMAGKL